MAEYIDKQKYREEWLKFKTFEPMKCLDLIPTADVIERTEIEKALEIIYKVREMVLHSNRVYEVNDVLDIIDEISACFERHIGE